MPPAGARLGSIRPSATTLTESGRDVAADRGDHVGVGVSARAHRPIKLVLTTGLGETIAAMDQGRTNVSLPSLPIGRPLDPITREQLQRGLPSFGWQPTVWMSEGLLVQSRTGPVVAFGMDYSPITHYVGVELGSGHVVMLMWGEKEYESWYYAASLSVFLDQIQRFNMMLPLYTSAERDSAENGLSAELRAAENVEAMLRETDPPSMDGVWHLLMDIILYGDYADLVECIPTPEEGWITVDGVRQPFRLPRGDDGTEPGRAEPV